MFRGKFCLVLEVENFYPDIAVCLGSQMISIINFLEIELPSHIWYAGDVNAIGLSTKKYNLNSKFIKKIGPTTSLINRCLEVDQFLSGVFFAIQSNPLQGDINIQVDTEDEQFRLLNVDGILIEIRAFDTSFFEIFSEDVTTIKRLSDKFQKCVKENNQYTWNDRISVKKNAPKKYFPEQVGVICGMSKIKVEAFAKKIDLSVGDWMYTIELKNGLLIEIPELYIEKYETDVSEPF